MECRLAVHETGGLRLRLRAFHSLLPQNISRSLDLCICNGLLTAGLGRGRWGLAEGLVQALTKPNGGHVTIPGRDIKKKQNFKHMLGPTTRSAKKIAFTSLQSMAI